MTFATCFHPFLARLSHKLPPSYRASIRQNAPLVPRSSSITNGNSSITMMSERSSISALPRADGIQVVGGKMGWTGSDRDAGSVKRENRRTMRPVKFATMSDSITSDAFPSSCWARTHESPSVMSWHSGSAPSLTSPLRQSFRAQPAVAVLQCHPRPAAS
ncbi:hypothetical protein BD310DRAFT_422742 [Dichomitus squalens]|uniref:Uncharacterized protein n=1 Tax=Dichomitus squalens TaxID=114155 RepID=A0A4Q9PDN7_9APHY|nr:hypothetical protein BD310DRAFT_422742 [Dichomitus squalens]